MSSTCDDLELALTMFCRNTTAIYNCHKQAKIQISAYGPQSRNSLSVGKLSDIDAKIFFYQLLSRHSQAIEIDRPFENTKLFSEGYQGCAFHPPIDTLTFFPGNKQRESK